MSKPRVNIENWQLLMGVLYGNVQDHPRFDKDTSVKTSTILNRPADPQKGDEIETRNTIYILGEPFAPTQDGLGGSE